MKFSPTYPTLALLLLTTIASGCNLLSDKYCIGDCPEGSSESSDGSDGSDGSDSLGGSETGLPDDELTTGSTGTPQDPAPTCDLVDTIVTFDTCSDQTVQPGELCFILGSGSEQSSDGVVSMIAAQLEGPGTDLLIARAGKMVSAMLFAQGQGLSVSSNDWPLPLPFVPDGELHLSVVGDFNEDGIPDVAGRIDGPDHDEIVILTLDGAGGLLGAASVMTGVDLVGPDLYDDEQGHLDLLVTWPQDLQPGNENVVVLHGDGTGEFTPKSIFGYSEAHQLHVTGALGTDGFHNDILVVTDGRFDAFISHGGSMAIVPISIKLGGRVVKDLSITDLNGDGRGDIVALVTDPMQLTSEVAVFTQLASGSEGEPEFSAAHYTVHCGAVALAVGDVDNDGAPDIATASMDTPIAPVTIRINDGAGGFADVLTVVTAGPVDDLFIADLNNDGAADLATASRATSAIGYTPSMP